jgi:hypothetical protein
MSRCLGHVDVLAAAVDAAYRGERRRMVADHGYPLRHVRFSLHTILGEALLDDRKAPFRVNGGPKEASVWPARPMPRRNACARTNT